MSDHDLAGNAWHLPPSRYLSERPATHALPARPLSVYVPMRDGCRIAVDVYLPDGGAGASPASFPTVAIFTPYNRRFRVQPPGSAEPSPNAAKYRDMFVPRGYAVVVADVRGTGASFGTRDALRSPAEAADYAQIADWIVQQPWSNGVIGSTGISYLGAAAVFLAGSGHPAVRAIAPLFAVSDIYAEQLYPGGLLSRVWVEDYDTLMKALDQNRRDLLARYPYFNDPRLQGPQPVDEDADGSLLAQALAEHRHNFSMAELAPQFVFRDEASLHDAALDIAACSPCHYHAGIGPEVAVYSISGWYDGGGYANGAISRYLSLAGPHDRLLLGPWDHGARTNVSPWRAQPASAFPLLAEVLRFFDQHLMGRRTGLEQEAPVHYFSMHDECWRAAGQWPPCAAQATLHADAQGRLQAAPAQAAQRVLATRYDWSSGRHTRYERLGAANIEDYYPDWAERCAALPAFDTEPLQAPLALCGHPLLRLRAAADQGDAAFFAYLSEVLPDGSVRYITEGMLRALHRTTAQAPPHYRTCWPYRRYSRADAQRLTPGRTETFEIPLLPVAWTLQPGSRLRLSIAGADDGHFPQTPPGRPPRVTLALGGLQGTELVLPLAP
ncbi:CocE/NonD family hydrolase [Orrella sp. JC864]|uniref:CocE/NonD family hydrolase n=1 Tax=Orrella sp. JC864 TaxID=3120298 RepID=UPI003009E79E